MHKGHLVHCIGLQNIASHKGKREEVDVDRRRNIVS